MREKIFSATVTRELCIDWVDAAMRHPTVTRAMEDGAKACILTPMLDLFSIVSPKGGGMVITDRTFITDFRSKSG